jgi:APA family basic amino acid/polyamine antiporter
MSLFDFGWSQHKRLKRTLRTPDVVFFIMANVIGVGIFLTPPQVAANITNAYWFLIVWFVGGLIALTGAMTTAELGVIMPRAGGDYVFLRNTYGKSLGFMYGYLSFTVSYTGSVATLATGVVHYQGRTLFGDIIDTSVFALPSIGFDFTLAQLLPIIIIILFTTLNHYGLKLSMYVQRVITLGPIIILILSGFAIIFNVFTDHDAYKQVIQGNFQQGSFDNIPSITAVAMAMIPIYFSYSGWNASLYLSEDIKAPTKIIPRSMIIGVFIVTGIYLLFSFVFLSTISYDTLSGDKSIDVISTVGSVLLGQKAKIVTAILIASIILGSLNSAIISGSRVYLAMARDKIFFHKASYIHDKHGTPHWSLWSQAVWASMLILVFRQFDAILELTTIMMLIMSVMVVGSVFILRRKLRNENHYTNNRLKKVYRTFGYPVIPAIYIVATLSVLYLMITSSQESLHKGLIAIGVIVVGFIIFFAWNYKHRRNKNNSY